MLAGRLLILLCAAFSANAAKILTDSFGADRILTDSVGAAKTLTDSVGASKTAMSSGGADKILMETSMASTIHTRYHEELDRMLQERLQTESLLNKTMSVEGAYNVLQRRRLANATALAVIADSLHAGNALHAQRLRAHPSKSLVEEKYSPSSGLQKANAVLGQMITEADMEYDQLHLECSQFFKKQCSLMETCRQDISSANSLAAQWRSKVLGAQSEINVCEVRLPRLKFDLTTSIKECDKRLGYLRRDLAIVMNDVAVMEEVIKLTQCTGKSFMMLGLPKLCECTHRNKSKTFTTVGHEQLHGHLSSLQSEHVRRLVQEELMDLSERETEGEGEDDAEAELSNVEALPVVNATVGPNITITKFKNNPLPQAALPSDPCKGISYDSGEGGGGCVLRKSPACFNLQNKFLTIQGETVDKRDALLEEIKKFEDDCKNTKDTLEGEIQAFTTKESEEHTKLAEGTSGENSAAEEGQTKALQHEELKQAMLTMRTSCSSKFRGLESELCALKKIRGELNKMKGDKHPFFQDCEVAPKWEEKECSVTCGGGTQELTRACITPPSGGGAACPPTKQMQTCNEQPCPVDCKLSQWSGFSACSADCGGGVSERTRNVKVQPKYQGDPCGETAETIPCNMQACDQDCVLAKWSTWSDCSKACDSGRRTRHRAVKHAAIGRGKCPLADAPERLERLPCNTQACVRSKTQPLQCSSKIDLVLLLDGSGSLGQTGWEESKQFAKLFVKAFDGPTADSQIAIILFSGPDDYSTMRKCAGAGAGLDMEKDCKVKMVQHFSGDMSATITNIENMAWPRGTTLTSQAIELANSELTLGRSDSQKVVLTITDGIPVSSRSTGMSADRVRTKARLMFGAVKVSSRGLRYMMDWGSKPTKENVLKIDSFQALDSLDTVDTLVADICKNITVPVGP